MPSSFIFFIFMSLVPLICFVLGWGWSMMIAAREEEYFWVGALFLIGLISPLYCLTQWDKAKIPFFMTAIPIAMLGITYICF